MNYIKKIIVFLFLTPAIEAQVNLVVNPSFESYTTCPSNQGQIQYATNWSSFCGSPDYFNVCNVNPQSFSVPKTKGNYQQPASGSAYAGIYTYELNTPTNLREVIGSPLVSPLQIGLTYYVSFKANLVLDTFKIFNRATNNIGARFSTIPFYQGSPAPINNFAHVYSLAVISDTANWTTISGSFTADSAYQYISIGNFFDDNNTTVVYMQDTTYDQAAYYFLDDIYVSTSPPNGINDITNIIDFNIFPNPFENFTVINLSSLEYASEGRLTIQDIAGRIMVNKKINFIDGKYILNQDSFQKGIYFIKLQIDEYYLCKKIIIK
ncbi:MAG: T9SS type A sorting domain-containing protein [Bacteroidia bacterium]